MLTTKLVPVARTVRFAARGQLVRCMGGHAPAHWKTDKAIAIEQQAHMNDLPIPQGAWQDNYNKRNSKWNTQLGLSFVLLLVTVVAMSQYDCLYLHGMPATKK